jgi:sugar phosphate isomerase/epimerase
MHVGVLDSVIGGRDELDRFERARCVGCTGIEVMLLRCHLRDPSTPDRLRAAKAATGLELPTLVLDEHNLGGIASPDPSTAAAAAEDVRTAVAWAAELDAGAILIPFFVEAELRNEAAFERAATAFRELCPLAASHGVMLAYEGTLPAASVRRLAERVGSPAFACYFDLANLLVRGLDPPTEIRQLGELVRRVHVKDLRARKNDCRPGLGRVDFRQCAAALREIGYDGWVVLETPAAPLPVVARDVAFTQWAFDIERESAWPVYGTCSNEFAHWEALAARFGALGLRAVQLGGELLEQCLDDRAAAAQGRAVLEAEGVRVTALSGYRNLVAPNADLAHVRRCLEAAPALGAWVVATGTGTRSAESDWADHPDNWSRESWQRLEDAVEQLLPAAESSGAVLAVEGTWMTVLRTLSQVIDLLERHPSDYLQLVCDPYNFVSYELLPAERSFLDEYLARFEPRFVLAHLKDVGIDGTRTTRPEFGTGVFDHASLLAFLRDRRPDLPLVLEQLPLDHIPAAIARVGAYLG